MVWPAEWRVLRYWGGGLPREATRSGRRSMRGSAGLGESEVGGMVEGGEEMIFVIRFHPTFLSAIDAQEHTL